MGFIPAGGTLVRLQRQIGYAPAMEILLTGERFDAAHMRRIGVVNRVVPPEELAAVAHGYAERVAALSSQALQTIKESVLTLGDLPLDEAFAREAEFGQRTFTSDDARAGLRAFADRRAADART